MGGVRFTYQPNGNLVTKSEGEVSASLSYPAGNQPRPHTPSSVNSQSYTYDANGNLINRTGQSFTYDAENRLTQVISGTITCTFTYDGDGALVKKVTAEGTTLYIGPHYEVQPQPATPPSPPQPPSPLPRRAFLPLIVNSGLIVDGHLMQPVKYYLIGGQRIASRTGSAGPVTYYYHDHLGSTVGSSGGESTRYWPYGATRSGSVGTAYQFTGQRREAGAGLYFFQSRWYDGAIGRFVQPDPLVPSPGDPQSLNRYAYVRNNPLRFTDPTGHWTEDELAAVLGPDWRANYFGKGKVFEGRDELLHLLTSANSTNLVELTLIHDIMVPTSILHNSGVDVRSLDAVGLRLTFGGGAYMFGGGTADVLLNVKSGEFSVFGSAEVGGILGGAGNITVGMLGVRNLPSNESYRGSVLALGGVGGDGPASQIEYFWSSPVSDRFEATDKANGWALTLGGGAGAGIYGSISYSYEMLRQTSAGMELLPHPPSMGTMINELRVALYHDFLLHPWWPWSPYTK